ncbi:MAG: sensor histidine kinase, partial [Spirochaetia bacterium]|nr:sensor histidine kinase [Spirochaetia bacterium]
QRVQERTSELARVNEHLRESIREKDVLLKEIHHRVKNNLQIVSSILSLQSNYIDDEKFLQIFQESQARIKSIALIHELLYEKGHLAKIDFGSYLHDLVNSIFRSLGGEAGRIKYSVDADSVLMELSAAIHCGLIVNELVTNAIKYAFPDNARGAVHVKLKGAEGKWCVLTVEDNGVGLPKDLDPRKAVTMGLQLVDTLVSQIGAQITIEREHGTGFVLKFPWQKSSEVHQ